MGWDIRGNMVQNGLLYADLPEVSGASSSLVPTGQGASATAAPAPPPGRLGFFSSSMSQMVGAPSSAVRTAPAALNSSVRQTTTGRAASTPHAAPTPKVGAISGKSLVVSVATGAAATSRVVVDDELGLYCPSDPEQRFFGPGAGFFAFEERANIEIKGRGVQTTYFVTRADPPFMSELAESLAQLQHDLEYWNAMHGRGPARGGVSSEHDSPAVIFAPPNPAAGPARGGVSSSEHDSPAARFAPPNPSAGFVGLHASSKVPELPLTPSTGQLLHSVRSEVRVTDGGALSNPYVVNGTLRRASPRLPQGISQPRGWPEAGGAGGGRLDHSLSVPRGISHGSGGTGGGVSQTAAAATGAQRGFVDRVGDESEDWKRGASVARTILRGSPSVLGTASPAPAAASRPQAEQRRSVTGGNVNIISSPAGGGASRVGSPATSGGGGGADSRMSRGGPVSPATSPPEVERRRLSIAGASSISPGESLTSPMAGGGGRRLGPSGVGSAVPIASRAGEMLMVTARPDDFTSPAGTQPRTASPVPRALSSTPGQMRAVPSFLI